MGCSAPHAVWIAPNAHKEFDELPQVKQKGNPKHLIAQSWMTHSGLIWSRTTQKKAILENLYLMIKEAKHCYWHPNKKPKSKKSANDSVATLVPTL